MKAFLSLLYLTPIAFTFAIAPIVRILWRHVLLALKVSKADPWAMDMWWGWYGSWVFFGGPLGRWVWGAVLGFRILNENHNEDDKFSGSSIEQPRIRIFAIVMPAMMLSMFVLVSTGL